MTKHENSLHANSDGNILSRLKMKYLTHRERRSRGAGELSRIKRSDLVLYSPGNSGRTWLRAMITRAVELHFQLNIGPAIRFDNRHKLDSRVPKIAVTHNRWLPYYKKPQEQRECREYYQSKVLILVRNPLDTCVSQYFQWLYRSKDENIRLKGWPPRNSGLSLQDFLEHPDTGVERLCRELNIWLRESQKIRDAMFVRYEDMRKDPENELAQVMSFLGIPVPAQIIKDAVDFSSFENMRKRESAGRLPEHAAKSAKIPEAADAFKSRRGKISGYSKYLSSQECAHFIQLVRSRLCSDFGYSNLPEIGPAKSLGTASRRAL